MRTILPVNARLVPTQAKKVFSGEIYDVYQWPQKMFDGSVATFERLKRPDTVRIIVVKQDKIIVIADEQSDRQPITTLPGGRHDIKTEDELASAKRELKEETGLICKTWRLIDIVQPAQKIEWFVYTFLATEVIEQVLTKLDTGERIKVLELSYDEVLQKVQTGPRNYLPAELFRRAGSLKGLLALDDISKDDTKTVRLNKS